MNGSALPIRAPYRPTNEPMEFSPAALGFDPARETVRICGRLRELLASRQHGRGLVVGLSGSLDAAILVALAARALGPARVLALEPADRDSSPEGLLIGARVGDRYGIPRRRIEICDSLEAAGYHERYLRGVRQVIPEFDGDWSAQLLTDRLFDRTGLSRTLLVARRPDDTLVRRPLSLAAYLEIVAALQLAEGVRQREEYREAERHRFALLLSPDRFGLGTGFLLRLPGNTGLRPIAHLYPGQVVRLAEYLGIPADIIRRPPPTALLPPGGDFRLLTQAQFDLCLHGYEKGIPAPRVAAAASLASADAEIVYQDIERKQQAVRGLRRRVDPIPRIDRRPERNAAAATAKTFDSDPVRGERRPAMIESRIHAYIKETFLGGDDRPLTAETSFLDEGIIDSTGIMKLAAFLEEEFNLKIRAEELVPENLDSIRRVSEFLRRKGKDADIEVDLPAALRARA